MQPRTRADRPGIRTLNASRRPAAVLVGAAVLAGSLLISVAGWSAARDDLPYEATSVVGPVDLALNPVRVARTVSALTTIDELDGEVHTEIRPVEDTRLALVVARGTDPEATASAANRRARRLVGELDRLGATLASFAVLTDATIPRAPRSEPSLVSFLVPGLAGGACLAFAALGVLGRRRVEAAR